MELGGRGANKGKTAISVRDESFNAANHKHGEQQRNNNRGGAVKDFIQRNGMLAERTVVIYLGKNTMNVPGLQYGSQHQNGRCGCKPQAKFFR